MTLHHPFHSLPSPPLATFRLTAERLSDFSEAATYPRPLAYIHASAFGFSKDSNSLIDFKIKNREDVPKEFIIRVRFCFVHVLEQSFLFIRFNFAPVSDFKMITVVFVVVVDDVFVAFVVNDDFVVFVVVFVIVSVVFVVVTVFVIVFVEVSIVVVVSVALVVCRYRHPSLDLTFVCHRCYFIWTLSRLVVHADGQSSILCVSSSYRPMASGLASWLSLLHYPSTIGQESGKFPSS